MTRHRDGTTGCRGELVAARWKSLRMREAPHLLDATMFWNASGGVRRYVVAKRQWLLREAGWRHTVATPTPDADADTEVDRFADSRGMGDHPAATAFLRVPSLPLPGSGGAYRLPWRREASARLLAAAKPDLIESADPYRLAWAALDAARARRVPAVAFCHSNLERMAALAFGRRGPALARRYAAHLYRRFDLVLAPSRAMVAHLHDWGVVGALHQPLGVDTTVFHPGRRDPGLRERLGLAHDARLLVFAGRFAPEKELQTLATAVERLDERYHLVAIGAGPRPPAGRRVRLLPPIHDPAALAGTIAACDAFVHAGAQETFGLSALEAMACAVPVVARAAEGLAELVDSSVGRAVTTGRPDDFAAAIEAVFADDLSRLGRAAQLRAEANDWNRVLPSLYHRYRDLMGLTAAESVWPQAA